MSNNLMTLVEFYNTHKSLAQNEIILDVRGADEFAQGHIAGALNIPVTEVLQHTDKLNKYSKIYIHCKRGGRAKTAFEALKNAGLNNLICVHDAGMDLWVENGYPVNK